MSVDIVVLEEMAALGLAAFDPVGLAAMPILLAQPRGVTRAWTFVAGSATALMVLGVAFALGLGRPILAFNRSHPWLVHGFELLAGGVLLGIGVWLLMASRRGEVLTSQSFERRLRLPLATLFGFGVLLVTVQSLVDVVFLLAMVEMGTKALAVVEIVVAVATYTVMALLLQVIVVVAYQTLPERRRGAITDGFARLLAQRGHLIAGIASLVLGAVLVAIGVIGIL